MKTRLTIILFFIFNSISFAASEDAAFEQFKQQQSQGVDTIKAEFSAYQKALNEGFKAYKNAYEDAVKAEQKQVKSVWGDYRPGDKKRWVQYEKGGVRKSVNFESGEVELEMIVDKKASTKKSEQALKQKIISLLKTTQRQAFKSDKVTSTVEKKVSRLPQVKTAQISEVPVMAVLVPKAKIENAREVKQLSKKYAEKAKVDTRPAKLSDKKIVRVKFKIPVDAPRKSKPFVPTAKKIAEREKLPLTLVMAIMETESAFNPMAKSHVPAYGLMQIVPRSAGQDATAYLFGKAKILSPSYLYNSENNIQIGGAYLHILYYTYLAKINDPVSRMYCTIAAYNTGAGNVAKAFTGTTNIKVAANRINLLSPRQVYQKLRKKLPYVETRKYVKKVSQKMQKYQKI